MGLTKREHIAELLTEPATAAQLEGATVDELYEEFLQARGRAAADCTGIDMCVWGGRNGGQQATPDRKSVV